MAESHRKSRMGIKQIHSPNTGVVLFYTQKKHIGGGVFFESDELNTINNDCVFSISLLLQVYHIFFIRTCFICYPRV